MNDRKVSTEGCLVFAALSKRLTDSSKIIIRVFQSDKIQDSVLSSIDCVVDMLSKLGNLKDQGTVSMYDVCLMYRKKRSKKSYQNQIKNQDDALFDAMTEIIDIINYRYSDDIDINRITTIGLDGDQYNSEFFSDTSVRFDSTCPADSLFFRRGTPSYRYFVSRVGTKGSRGGDGYMTSELNSSAGQYTLAHDDASEMRGTVHFDSNASVWNPSGLFSWLCSPTASKICGGEDIVPRTGEVPEYTEDLEDMAIHETPSVTKKSSVKSENSYDWICFSNITNPMSDSCCFSNVNKKVDGSLSTIFALNDNDNDDDDDDDDDGEYDNAYSHSGYRYHSNHRRPDLFDDDDYSDTSTETMFGRGPAFSVLETIYEVDDEDDDEDDDDDELEEEEVSREWGHTMYQSTPAYDDSVDDDQVYDADSIYDGRSEISLECNGYNSEIGSFIGSNVDNVNLHNSGDSSQNHSQYSSDEINEAYLNSNNHGNSSSCSSSSSSSSSYMTSIQRDYNEVDYSESKSGFMDVIIDKYSGNRSPTTPQQRLPSVHQLSQHQQVLQQHQQQQQQILVRQQQLLLYQQQLRQQQHQHWRGADDSVDEVALPYPSAPMSDFDNDVMDDSTIISEAHSCALSAAPSWGVVHLPFSEDSEFLGR